MVEVAKCHKDEHRHCQSDSRYNETKENNNVQFIWFGSYQEMVCRSGNEQTAKITETITGKNNNKSNKQ